MKRLDLKTVMSAGSIADRLHVQRSLALPERVLQFGSGNFMRAFLCWMTDQMNRQELFNGRVIIAQATHSGITGQVLDQQSGLFTVVERGVSGDQEIDQDCLLASVSRSVQPFHDWQALLRCALLPDLRFVFSNTTEAGIRYEPCEHPAAVAPVTFPAQLAALLSKRFRAFDGDLTKGLIVLPCELIENNGTTLRKHVMEHLAAWKTEPRCTTWVEESCQFLNTLVDRIVPGFPTTEAERLYARLGWQDSLATVCEPYHLFVIEGSAELEQELPLRRAGLNVIWARNLAPYRTQKVRLLNGAHTLLAALGYICSKKTVKECVEDRTLAALLWRAWHDEIMPCLPLEQTEMVRYCATLLERFRNPFLEHQLSSIRLNSVSKLRVRIVPSMVSYAGRFGSPPRVLCLSMAALLVFFRDLTDGTGNAEEAADRPANTPTEEPSNMLVFAQAWNQFQGHRDATRLCHAILSETSLWGENLDALPGLTAAVATCLNGLLKDSKAYIEFHSREAVVG